MDTYEAQLLDRLNEYYKAKKNMEEAIEDIKDILLLYEFDINKISQDYPILSKIKASKKKPVKKIKANL